MDPAIIGVIIDRAEREAEWMGGPLMRLPPLDRRHLVAQAVLIELRRGTLPPEPEPLLVHAR